MQSASSACFWAILLLFVYIVVVVFVWFCFALCLCVHLIFLDGLLFDLFYLGQYFVDDNFPNAMTTESWKQCSRQNGQIAEEKVINSRSNVCKRNKTTSSSQIILKMYRRKKSLEQNSRSHTHTHAHMKNSSIERKKNKQKSIKMHQKVIKFALQDKSLCYHHHLL